MICYDLKIFGRDTILWIYWIWGCKKKNRNIEIFAFKDVRAMHITNQKLSCIYGRKFTKYLHGTWYFLNILMIFVIKEISKFWPIRCIVGYWYKYTRATYDWFCGPVTFCQSFYRFCKGFTNFRMPLYVFQTKSQFCLFLMSVLNLLFFLKNHVVFLYHGR